jgi:hypothetical protein
VQPLHHGQGGTSREQQHGGRRRRKRGRTEGKGQGKDQDAAENAIPSVRDKFKGEHVSRNVLQRARLCRFDEIFDLILPDDLFDVYTAFLHIAVKDRGVMGEGIFLGEAYLPLKNVLQNDMDVRLEVSYNTFCVLTSGDHQSPLCIRQRELC